jgi:catalase
MESPLHPPKDFSMNHHHHHRLTHTAFALCVTPLCFALAFSPRSAIAAESATDAAAVAATPAQMVGALRTAFGTHHARAVHAKGVILEGSFIPSAEAKQLSQAGLFAAGTIPVTVRFSDFTGIPDIPDTVGDANPRGLALKFRVKEGEAVDVVTHSFNGFPTPTAESFRELLLAIGASGPDAAKPTALDRFLDSHPIAKTFLTTQKPAPVSFATLSYFGVNAFKFINASGQEAFVRYRFVPSQGEQFLEPAVLKTKGPNYLREEIALRAASRLMSFDWFAQIAAAGDAIADPSVAWPESRRLVKLGVVRITRMAVDQAASDKATLFMPGNLPTGIAIADPMVQVRNAAYPLSFRDRQ